MHSSLISCTAALCDDPPEIINGMVTFTGNSVGDTTTYTCNSEFELIGINTTACTQVNESSATYPSVPPPECRREYRGSILLHMHECSLAV